MKGSLLFDHEDEHSTFLRNIGKLLSDYTASHLRRRYGSQSPSGEPQLSRSVEPLQPEPSARQLQYRSSSIRVFVCIYKELLVSQLLISTTCVKLSHIRERMRCRYQAERDNNTTAFEPRLLLIETIGPVNVVWQHVH
jgi:hypothetical protein